MACFFDMRRPASCSATRSTPLSAWFLMVFGLIAIPVAVYSVGYFAHAIPPSRMAAVGAAFNVMLGAVELVFVAGDVITFLFAWELMTLATAALVATEHEDARQPARRVPVPRDVARRHRLFGGWLSDAGGGVRLAVVLVAARRPSGRRGRARRGVRAVLRRLWRESGRHPASCLVAGGASRGAEQHFGAHVRGADHRRASTVSSESARSASAFPP